jgi:DNA-binding CsgD family transcriptional regulator
LALGLSGQPRDAARALAAFDALDLAPSAAMFKPVDLTLARAWAAVADGDLETGRSVFEEAADQARRRGDLVGEAASLHCLARTGYPDAATHRLRALATMSDGGLVAVRADHTAALVDRDTDRLAAASSAFEAMGADLLAAEAAADAAVAAHQSGEPRRAAAFERDAMRLAEQCEGPVTPALQSIATRAQLTPQERRAAMLAAVGRSNKQIAEELFLSVRTIENHLQRVYEKLGIRSRTELGAALGVDPVPSAG